MPKLAEFAMSLYRSSRYSRNCLGAIPARGTEKGRHWQRKGTGYFSKRSYHLPCPDADAMIQRRRRPWRTSLDRASLQPPPTAPASSENHLNPRAAPQHSVRRYPLPRPLTDPLPPHKILSIVPRPVNEKRLANYFRTMDISKKSTVETLVAVVAHNEV